MCVCEGVVCERRDVCEEGCVCVRVCVCVCVCVCVMCAVCLSMNEECLSINDRGTCMCALKLIM